MDHVLLDLLEIGQIPLYEFGQGHYYVWDKPAWNIVPRTRRNRALVSTSLDEPLTLLVDELVGRLGFLQLEDGRTALDSPGTLVLSLRSCETWSNFDGWVISGDKHFVDRHGVLLLGGLAFFPDVEQGMNVREQGVDPVYYIEQMCLGLAGREYDRQYVAIQETLERQVVEQQKRTALRLLAITKALDLLMSHLSDDQLAEFENQKQFHVQGGDGYTYLITDKCVFRVEQGKRTVEYCIVSSDPIPNPDQMLMQKLLLEADPEMFHKTAHSWPIVDEGDRVRRYLDPAEIRDDANGLPEIIRLG